MNLLALGILLFAPMIAAAQADARIELRSGRFSVVATPRDTGLARHLIADAEARDTFPGLPRPRLGVRIVIAADERDFRGTVGGSAPEWGAAVAFPGERRIVMRGQDAPAKAGEPRQTLRHELAHLALHEAIPDGVPRWFDEGYASFAAGEWGRDEVLASSIVLAVRGVPRFETLDTLVTRGAGSAEQGYALAHRAVADLAARDPARGLAALFDAWRGGGTLDAAVRTAFGITLDGYEDAWRRDTRRRYGALALLADLSFATLVLFVLVGPFWLARRRRDRRKLAEMRAAEALADRRDQESALAALLGEGEQSAGYDDQIKGR